MELVEIKDDRLGSMELVEIVGWTSPSRRLHSSSNKKWCTYVLRVLDDTVGLRSDHFHGALDADSTQRNIPSCDVWLYRLGSSGSRCDTNAVCSSIAGVLVASNW